MVSFFRYKKVTAVHSNNIYNGLKDLRRCTMRTYIMLLTLFTLIACQEGKTIVYYMEGTNGQDSASPDATFESDYVGTDTDNNGTDGTDSHAVLDTEIGDTSSSLDTVSGDSSDSDTTWDSSLLDTDTLDDSEADTRGTDTVSVWDTDTQTDTDDTGTASTDPDSDSDNSSDTGYPDSDSVSDLVDSESDPGTGTDTETTSDTGTDTGTDTGVLPDTDVDTGSDTTPIDTDTDIDTGSDTTPVDPCEGVVCDSPPSSAFCNHVTSDYLGIPTGWYWNHYVGTCVAGECEYTYTEDYCPDVLDAPVDSCVDEFTAPVPSEIVCNPLTAQCEYEESDDTLDCFFGCEEGACKAYEDGHECEVIAGASGNFGDGTEHLYWQADQPLSVMTYAEAEEYCENLVCGDYDDWKIPTFNHVLSALDADQCTNGNTYINNNVTSGTDCSVVGFWNNNADCTCDNRGVHINASVYYSHYWRHGLTSDTNYSTSEVANSGTWTSHIYGEFTDNGITRYYRTAMYTHAIGGYNNMDELGLIGDNVAGVRCVRTP